MTWAILLALLVVPQTAMADPFTAAMVAWLGEGGFIIAMGYVKTALYAGFVINGVMQARRQKKAARSAFESSMRDRTVVVRSSETPRKIVYGRARVSGQLVYAKAFGTYNEYLSLVIELAGHEVDAIEDIWFNDESIGALDPNGWVTGGRYFKTRSQAETKSGTIPVGGVITLDHTPGSIASVTTVIGDASYGTPAYTTAGATVTITDPVLVGQPYTITYYRTAATPLVQVKKFLGSPAGQTDTELEVWSGGEWTPAHLGKSVARIRLTLIFDQDLFPSGIPNISAILRGKKIYDPRTGLTAWSNNPALVARDYLTDTRFGFGVDSADVDDAMVIAAANIADELVPGYEINSGVRVSTGIARYTCDGVISSAEDRLENMQAILSSMVGTCVYSGGKWLIRAGAYVTPTVSLDDSDLADGGVEVQAASQRRDLFNAVRGQFVDPAQLYQVLDFPPYESTTYRDADGGETLWRDIALPMTNSASRAQRIAKLILYRSRQALTVSATFKLAAYRLQPGDTFSFTSEFFGWTAKVFRVVDRRLIQPGRVQLVIQEEASAVYAWDFDEDKTGDPAPNTSLPDPRDVPDIENLAVTSGASIAEILSDGTVRPMARVSWDAVTNIGVLRGGYIELVWKRGIDTAWHYARLAGVETEYMIPTAPGELVNVGVRAVNGALVAGAWSYAVHEVASDALSNATDTVRGAGVNLLPNAAFRSGTIWPWGSWANTGSGFAGGAAGHIAPGASGGNPSYGAIACSWSGGSVGQTAGGVLGLVTLPLAAMPVKAGDRIEASMYVAPYRGSCELKVIYYNATKVWISEPTVTGGVSSCAEDGRAWDASLASKTRLWGFSEAPVGAAFAVLYAVATRDSAVGNVDLYVNLPYIGLAHQSQTLPSPWVEGPNAVSTELITDSAATTVDSATYAGGTFSRDWGSIGNETFADTEVSVTNSESVSRDVLLTMTVLVSDDLTSPQNGAIGMSYWTGSAWQWLGAPWYINLRPEYGGNGSYTVSGVVSVSAGGTGTYRLMQLRQGGSTESVTWGPVNTRAELIKR